MCHGYCTGFLHIYQKTVKCVCSKGYFGLTCNFSHNCGNCPEGQCLDNKKCSKCPKGFGGPNCEIITCDNLNICNNHGTYCYEREMF